MEMTVEKTTPILEPIAQLNIGATFKLIPPPDGPARGHLSARDPVTGAKKWEVNYKQPPLASVLATAGNLVFVPDSEGIVHAYNADSGEELWSRRHHKLHGRRQAVCRRTGGLGQPGGRRVCRALWRALHEHAEEYRCAGCLCAQAMTMA